MVFTRLNWVDHIPEHLTTFSKVRQLELCFSVCRTFHVPKVFAILQACPLLQKFHLVANPSGPVIGSDNDKVGECEHNHLKEVVVGGFCGSKAQVVLVMQLVTYAVVLERMVVTPEAEISRDDLFYASPPCCLNVESDRLGKMLRERATSKKAVIILPWGLERLKTCFRLKEEMKD